MANPLRFFFLVYFIILGMAFSAEKVGAGNKAVANNSSKSKNPSVVMVGKTNITKNQVDTLVNLYLLQKYGTLEVPSEQSDLLRKLISSNLVNQELLKLECEQKNIQVSEKELDSALQTFKGQFKSETEFSQALKKAGDTKLSLSDKLKRLVQVEKLLQNKVPAGEEPDEKEIKEYYNQSKSRLPINDSLRASQIVFKINSNKKEAEQTKTKLEALRAEIAAESNLTKRLVLFTQAAIKYSETPEGQTGGDLKRFLPKDFFPEFKNEALKLKVGDISPVFKSPLGYHVIMLTEKYDGQYSSYRYQLTQLLAMHKMAKQQEVVNDYLQDLAQKYKVSYLDKAYSPPPPRPTTGMP